MPRSLHLIGPHEQGLVALQDVLDQGFIGIGQRLLEELLIGQMQGHPPEIMGFSGLLDADPHLKALIGLEPNHQVVGRNPKAVPAGRGGFLKLDHDHRNPGGQTLAGAQVKLHIVPAVVFHTQPQGGIGGCGGIRGHTGLLAVSGHRPAGDHAAIVLAKDQGRLLAPVVYSGGLQHAHLFVSNLVGLQVGRRFHGH